MSEAPERSPENRAEIDAYLAKLDAIVAAHAALVGPLRSVMGEGDQGTLRMMAATLLETPAYASAGLPRSERALADGEQLRGKRS